MVTQQFIHLCLVCRTRLQVACLLMMPLLLSDICNTHPNTPQLLQYILYISSYSLSTLIHKIYSQVLRHQPKSSETTRLERERVVINRLQYGCWR